MKHISNLFRAVGPAFLLILCLAMPVQAQAPRATSKAEVAHNIPISISADTMTYEPEKDRVVFRGNVEAVRAEFTMRSELLTLYLKPSAKKAAAPEPAAPEPAAPPTPSINPNLAPSDLDRIVAENNVRFRYNTQSGTAAKATYTIDTGVLVMDGNPILRDGENAITGSRILYFLNENRSEVESGPKRRVEAVFGADSIPGTRE